MTSSPGSSSVRNEAYTACLPPFVTRMLAGSTSRPESRLVLSAMACFSSGRPPAGLYLWFLGSRHASTAASTMWAGVGKSGSPAPKPITGSPAAWRALALASTARVADSAMAPIRAEMRAMRLVSLHAMSPDPTEIRIPADLLPSDGRFGSGPSKVRPEQVSALVAAAGDYLGTSHRQARVRFEVGALRNGLAELFALPDGYEVLLGNGGTTAFWDAASFGLVDQRSQHLRFGEFSSKFAEVCAAAPHLSAPQFLWAEPGSHPVPMPDDEVDAYCLTHNETSTGVAMPI